ncbi:hypothetical protein CC80DRAFT_499898 [Byssothecium circinans]|uniref:Uncharacterized protein n=1 Tax=Byssothecium circinans TaxID=147558 RepID=A0A6A5UBJ1_9PLEO|nr:hypothetical protein CC80DRAFT_499898 [Byssothecium circinans]
MSQHGSEDDHKPLTESHHPSPTRRATTANVDDIIPEGRVNLPQRQPDHLNAARSSMLPIKLPSLISLGIHGLTIVGTPKTHSPRHRDDRNTPTPTIDLAAIETVLRDTEARLKELLKEVEEAEENVFKEARAVMFSLNHSPSRLNHKRNLKRRMEEFSVVAARFNSVSTILEINLKAAHEQQSTIAPMIESEFRKMREVFRKADIFVDRQEEKLSLHFGVWRD